MRPATYLCFISLMIFGLSARAQSPDNRFRFGAKLGVNLSYFTNDIDLMDRPDQRYVDFRKVLRVSGAGGLTVDRQLSQRVMFGAELLYNSRGATYREENYNVPVEYDNDGNERRSYNYIKYRFDYMEVPFTIGYNFLPVASNTDLSGYVGIAPALLINHKRVIDYDKRATDTPDQKLDMRYGRDIITSVIGGLKLMDTKAFGANFFGDLRGSYTLAPVFTRHATDTGRNLDTRNFTFSLAIGVRFD